MNRLSRFAVALIAVATPVVGMTSAAWALRPIDPNNPTVGGIYDPPTTTTTRPPFHHPPIEVPPNAGVFDPGTPTDPPTTPPTTGPSSGNPTNSGNGNTGTAGNTGTGASNGNATGNDTGSNPGNHRTVTSGSNGSNSSVAPGGSAISPADSSLVANVHPDTRTGAHLASRGSASHSSSDVFVMIAGAAVASALAAGGLVLWRRRHNATA